jgi:hypothetical protein
MIDLLGNSFAVFIFITVILFGFAAFMTGQALANTWRPIWQAVPYSLGLGAFDRFLSWSLFDGLLLALLPYLLDTAVIFAFALIAHRMTQARKMATQYPWVYERTGPFTWRERGGDGSAGQIEAG